MPVSGLWPVHPKTTEAQSRAMPEGHPTIAFVAKAAALTAALFALGAILLSYLVDYTITLFRSIPHLIG